ncbi:hypothetical protein LTR66_016509 [Elasticomyces elasticus]|nr:hypothetical protein LTR66_016509 [Elasticomyces elasticus]
MYGLESVELANAMATRLGDLQELKLRFYHPRIHDGLVSSTHWRQTPAGSPAWNALVGLGSMHAGLLQLRSLRKLSIERAGLTSAQLRAWVGHNMQLEELELTNTAGVDFDFVHWLGQYCSGGTSRLRGITFVDCRRLVASEAGHLEWVVRLAFSGVHELDLKKCVNVKQILLLELLQDVVAFQHELSLRSLKFPDGAQAVIESGRIQLSSKTKRFSGKQTARKLNYSGVHDIKC